jgi:hypothetical protein
MTINEYRAIHGGSGPITPEELAAVRAATAAGQGTTDATINASRNSTNGPEMPDLGSVGGYLFGGNATKGINFGMPNATFGADYARGQLGQNAGAPQFGSADAAAVNAQQSQLAAMLQRQAMGQQAGAGELAVNRQVGQATAAQQAQAMMARGQNAALAARNAARNTADIGTTGAGMAAQAQMSDQVNAQNQLSQLLNAQRGQDINIGQGNQAAQVQTTGQNNTFNLGLLANLLGVDTATLQAQLNKAQIDAGDKGIMPGIIQTAGTIAAGKSDKTLKTDIRDGGKEADDVMSKIRASSYRYKNEPRDGTGRRLGVMAQDLEKSKMGKEAVVPLPDLPGKKGVDMFKGLSVALASVGRLHERLSAVENATGKR